MHQHAEASMTEETTEDPGGTADATTEEEDMVAWSTQTEATEAAGATTVTRTTPEPGRTAQMAENPGAWGTPGDRSETGSPGGGTTAAMAGATTSAIMTPEEADTTALNPEDG